MKNVYPIKQLLPLVKGAVLIWIIPALVLFIWSLDISAEPWPGQKKSIAKQKAKQFQQYYLELAGGYGIWSHTFQAGMQSQQPSIDVSASIGKVGSPFSLLIGYTFHTAFQQEIFLFKPKNTYGAIKVSLLEALGEKSRFDPYIFGGATYWQGILTDDVYDGIISYQSKEEKDQGFGGVMGTGVTYRINRLEIGPQFTYFMAGTGQYLAGGFEKQDISASYMTVVLKASYRFTTRKGVGCPTYK